MTTIELDPIAEELASLREQVRELRASVGKQSSPSTRSRRTVIVAGAAIAIATLMGVAGASAPGNPADVSFIALTVPHKVLSNASIARAATNSPVVIGGSTTVPSDATSVAMTVAVKSTAAGSLSIFPADHPASTTVDAVGFPAGSVVVTHVTEQSPGLSGKVSFRNNGTATATVTVTITGYSTQTTASNISGSGGIAGQVLTNTGTGAVWAPATSPLSFTPLTVLSPWTNGFLASGAPGYAVDGYGVVHLQGEIELYSPCVAGGNSSPVAFVMPLAIRPTVTLYLTANEYGGATGRIEIKPNGNVTVQADPSPPVPCVLEFVSLSGITYTLPY